MIIKKIKLKNVRSHLNTEIELENGITLITGRTGSGKSSILMGLEYCLFGNKSEIRPRHLIKTNAQRTEVKIKIELQNQEIIEIKRVLEKEKELIKTNLNESYVKIKNQKHTYSKAKDLDEKILKTINYQDYEKPIQLYEVLNYSRQGSLNNILTMTKEERQTYIDRILNIDKYKNSYDNLKELIKHFSQKTQNRDYFENLLKESNDRQKKDLDKKKENMKELNDAILENKNIEQRLKKIKEDKKKYEENEKQKIMLKSSLENLEKRKIILEEEKIEKPNLKELEEKEKKNKELVEEIEEIENVLIKKKEKKINHKNNEEKRIQLFALINNLQKVEKQEDLEFGDFKKLKEELNNINKTLKNYEKTKNIIDYKMIENNKNLNQINLLDVTCPTCKQEIKKDYKKEHQKHLKFELESQKNNLKEIIKEINEKEELKNYLKNQIKKFELQKQKNEEVQEKLKELSSLKMKLSELKKTSFDEKLYEELVNESHTLQKFQLKNESFIKLEKQKNEENEKKLLELKNIKEQRLNSKSRLNDLKQIIFDENLYQKLIEDFQKFREKIVKNEEILKLLEENIIPREVEINKLNKKIKKIKTYENILEFVKRFREDFKNLRENVRQNFLQQMKEEINTEFNQIRGTEEEYTAHIEEDYEPVLINSFGTSYETKQISGGEKTSLALSYRLSLSNVLTEEKFLDQPETLILDEPTYGFDKEDINSLPEILKKLKIKQIILISHENGLKRDANQIFEIEKTLSESTLKKL